MTPLESYQDLLYKLLAKTFDTGRYCRYCKHRGDMCKAPSVYCCPAVDQAVTCIEGDIFVQRRIADRDWLAD